MIAAVLLTACGGDAPPEENSPKKSPAGKPAVPSAAQIAAAKLTSDMVSAVRIDDAPGEPLMAVKFDLKNRPEIGQPLMISWVFLPKGAASGFTSTFVSDHGLSIPPSQPVATFSDIEPGAAYSYELKVLPAQNGVYYVSAIVQVRTDRDSRIQTFSVPIIVGTPPS